MHRRVFRDDKPLTGNGVIDPVTGVVQLPFRSLRVYTIVGWEPQRWVRIEAFYSRVQQTSLRVRRLGRSQSRRISDRDFQAHEDAVMDEPRFDPLDYVSVFNRRKWWFIVPVALALIVGGLLVWKLPRTYQATTTIAVSAARLAPNLVGSVEMDRPERMHAVSQQLLSRTGARAHRRASSIWIRTARLNRRSADIRGGVSVSLPDSITPIPATPAHRRQRRCRPIRRRSSTRYQVSVHPTTRQRMRSGS